MVLRATVKMLGRSWRLRRPHRSTQDRPTQAAWRLANPSSSALRRPPILDGVGIAVCTPELCSGDEADVLIETGNRMLGDEVFLRQPQHNGVWVRTPYAVDELRNERGKVDWSRPMAKGLSIFQLCLGALRTWQTDFGTLREEWNRVFGFGNFWDIESNARYAVVSPAIDYTSSNRRKRDGIVRAIYSAADKSDRFCDAVVLYGRSNREAAEYYMIWELVEMDLGHKNRVDKRLGIPQGLYDKVRRSCCSLPPTLGGRHARLDKPEELSLSNIRDETARLLQRWSEDLNGLPTRERVEFADGSSV